MISFSGAATKPAASVARARFSTDGRRLVFSRSGRVTVRLLGDEDTDHTRTVGEGVTPLVAFAPGDDVLVAERNVLRAWRLGDFAGAGDPE